MARKPKQLSRGERVCAFIESYLKIPEGSKVGQPLKLEAFQRKFILDIYDNPQGTRRAYLSLARKNAKTALTAAILLANIIGPEAKQNSVILAGANSRDQAGLIFKLACKMLMQNPELNGLYKIVPSTKRILGLRKNVEFQAIAADGKTAMGGSPCLVILDEVGQIVGPTSDFVSALETAQGAYDDPLLIAISTQSASDADLFSLWIDDAIRSNDPHTVCHLFAADADADLMDREQWKKANPALGIFRSEKDLEEQLKQASRIPSQEASVRNLLLNQRISLQSLWLAPSVWKENAGDIDKELFLRLPVHVGLDLSQRNDLTAAVFAVCDPDTGYVHLWPHVFIPSDGLLEKSNRDRAPYDGWVRGGQMIAVPGKTIDYAWVGAYLQKATHEMMVASCQFDRWGIEHFRAAAIGAGFEPMEWIPIGQGYKDFSPRLKAIEVALLQGKVRHGGHPLLNMSVANAISVQDPAGNKKLDKSAASQRIDPLVAAVMAAFPCLDGAYTEIDISSLIA